MSQFVTLPIEGEKMIINVDHIVTVQQGGPNRQDQCYVLLRDGVKKIADTTFERVERLLKKRQP